MSFNGAIFDYDRPNLGRPSMMASRICPNQLSSSKGGQGATSSFGVAQQCSHNHLSCATAPPMVYIGGPHAAPSMTGRPLRRVACRDWQLLPASTSRSGLAQFGLPQLVDRTTDGFIRHAETV